MTRQRKYIIAGRPPKNAMDRLGTPVRALVTLRVTDALIEDQRKMGIPEPPDGIIASDTVRLALYERLKRVGLLTPELENDPTWNSLKDRGLL